MHAKHWLKAVNADAKAYLITGIFPELEIVENFVLSLTRTQQDTININTSLSVYIDAPSTIHVQHQHTWKRREIMATKNNSNTTY